MKEKNEKMKKHEKLFWSAFTAILTNALIQYGWLAFVIVLVIIFLAITGYDLIQADKEQKKSKVDQLTEEIKILKEELKKKGGDE